MTDKTTAPLLQFRTRANRRKWQEERMWARKLSLRWRLMLNRDGKKREFLPIRPIWGVVSNGR